MLQLGYDKYVVQGGKGVVRVLGILINIGGATLPPRAISSRPPQN